jgi:hypothetical protein
LSEVWLLNFLRTHIYIYTHNLYECINISWNFRLDVKGLTGLTGLTSLKLYLLLDWNQLLSGDWSLPTGWTWTPTQFALGFDHIRSMILNVHCAKSFCFGFTPQDDFRFMPSVGTWLQPRHRGGQKQRD